MLPLRACVGDERARMVPLHRRFRFVVSVFGGAPASRVCLGDGSPSSSVCSECFFGGAPALRMCDGERVSLVPHHQQYVVSVCF